jgi:hypothetical protein
MAENSKHTETKNGSVTESSHVKHYGDTAYVTKKTKQARETLLKFPVPEKYCK